MEIMVFLCYKIQTHSWPRDIVRTTKTLDIFPEHWNSVCLYNQDKIIRRTGHIVKFPVCSTSHLSKNWMGTVFWMLEIPIKTVAEFQKAILNKHTECCMRGFCVTLFNLKFQVQILNAPAWIIILLLYSPLSNSEHNPILYISTQRQVAL